MWYFVAFLIWAIGGVITYILLDTKKGFERVWLSIFWPVLIPLYLVHYLHNKL